MAQRGQEHLGACEFQESESYYGACDALICREPAYFSCRSGDCANILCERHHGICPACGLTFCSSADVRLHDCFYVHETSSQCENSLIAPVLAQLEEKLAMPSHATLREFIRMDGDGFGHPLPREVPADFALAGLCLSGRIEDIPISARLDQKTAQVQRRAARQREARACRRFGLTITATRAPYNRVDLYKRSTVLIASGALVTRVFSGSPHYAQQSELLRLIGIHKQEDYVRNRLNALESARPQLYSFLLQRAEIIAKRESGEADTPATFSILLVAYLSFKFQRPNATRVKISPVDSSK
jgi:hypothetical protein